MCPEKYLNRSEHLRVYEWAMNEGKQVGFGILDIDGNVTNNLSSPRKPIFAKSIGGEPLIISSVRINGKDRLFLSCSWGIAKILDEEKRVEFPEFHPKKDGQQLDLFSYRNTPQSLPSEGQPVKSLLGVGQIFQPNMQPNNFYDCTSV
jgi:hypothetical protein